jgi:hypothetical protein
VSVVGLRIDARAAADETAAALQEIERLIELDREDDRQVVEGDVCHIVWACARARDSAAGNKERDERAQKRGRTKQHHELRIPFSRR